MRRGSNTNITIEAPDLEADIVDKVFIRMKQRGVTISKEATLNDGVASIELDVNETMKFAPGRLWMQLEAQTKDGKIVQSEVFRHSIDDTLGEETDESGYGFHIRYSN